MKESIKETCDLILRVNKEKRKSLQLKINDFVYCNKPKCKL
jgi:hypothetical protein